MSTVVTLGVGAVFVFGLLALLMRKKSDKNSTGGKNSRGGDKK